MTDNTMMTMKMMNRMLSFVVTFFFVLSSSGCRSSSIVGVDGARWLVVFAGPHETWGTEILRFLQSNALPGGNGPLKSWTWPEVENDQAPYRAFDGLVTMPDSETETTVILDAIKTAWDSAPDNGGVIIGSNDFDKVGINPYSGYDAISSVQNVVNYLGVEPRHVIIVMNYRTPKDDHWADVYMNHFDDGAVSYEQFVCNDQQAEKKWEWLDTVMNPLKVAQAYYDVGFNVQMIDMAGTFSRNQDPAHVLACRVLQVACDDNDFVLGIETDTGINGTHVPHVIPELSGVELDELEAVFNQRDCHYKYALHHRERYQVHNDGTEYWRECGGIELSEYYNQFTDTNFMLQIIQSQKGCASDGDNIDIIKLLNDRDQYAPGGSATARPIGVGLSSSRKHLVVFIGPHETQGFYVNNFFSKHAARPGQIENATLGGWIWPQVSRDVIDTEPANSFDALVDQADNVQVQNVLIESIQRAWDESEKGVIIGSEQFDRIAPSVHYGYDALNAVQRIVDSLGITRNDVAVIVTARSPRIEHWGQVWGGHFRAETYRDFVCSDEQADKRNEWLASTMNPLGLAAAYEYEGYNVIVVDADGTENLGLDIAHTIACDVLRGVECNDEGFVIGADERVPPMESFPIDDSLSSNQLQVLEDLFELRDCSYRFILDGQPHFEILNQRTIWSSCTDGHQSFYDQFADTDFLLNAIQAQLSCSSNNIDVEELVAEKLTVTDDIGSDDVGKKLVFFAGIHGTGSSEINGFLAGNAMGGDDSATLQGWVWPAVESDIVEVQPYKAFDLLVTEASDESTQNILLSSIQGSWNDAQDGVIIGSGEFANVGLNPYSGYDSLGAVQRVVNNLDDLSNDSVTVALTYRTPKVDHFSAIWSIHFEAEDYRSFICSEDQSDKRWEYIDSTMNPLKIAHAYTELGFNVVAIDADGTASRQNDVAHALACDVMGVRNCQNGWVTGLESETVDVTAVRRDIDVLTERQYSDLEALFLLRDCYYWMKLSSASGGGHFSTINPRSIGSTCSSTHAEVYQQLADTDFFLNAIRAQLGCERQEIDLNILLAASPVSSSSGKSSKVDTVGLIIILIAVFIVISLTATMFYVVYKRRRFRSSRSPSKSAPGMHAPSTGVFRDSPADGKNIQPYSDNGDTTNQVPQLYSDSAHDDDAVNFSEAVMA